MLIKRISVFIFALLIAMLSTIGAFALPTNNNDGSSEVTYNSLNTPSEGSSQLSGGANAPKYTVEVFGNNAISNDLRYYINCISFTAHSDGQKYNILIWIDKSGMSQARLFFTDVEGKNLTNSSLSFIAQNKIDISNEDENNHFEIVLKKDSLVVNNITLIHELDYISNINVLKVSSTINPNKEVVTQNINVITDGSTTIENSDFEEDNNLNNIHEKETTYTESTIHTEKEREEKKINSKILIVLVVVIVVVLAIVAFFLLSKRRVEQSSKNQSRKKASNNNRQNSNLYVQKQDSQIREKKSMNIPPKVDAQSEIHSAILEIPIAEPQPIKQSYTPNFTDKKDAVNAQMKKSNTALSVCQKIVGTQFKTDKILELPANCVPLYLNNIYALNVSSSEKPKFQAISEARSADYILVENQYLLINPLRFSGTSFKTYSDIQGISRCFDIKKNNFEIAPLGQKIIKFKPATIESNGTTFVLSQKGIIIVE